MVGAPTLHCGLTELEGGRARRALFRQCIFTGLAVSNLAWSAPSSWGIGLSSWAHALGLVAAQDGWENALDTLRRVRALTLAAVVNFALSAFTFLIRPSSNWADAVSILIESVRGFALVADIKTDRAG